MSTRTPGPPGTLKAWITPGDGANVSGSSALTRHSIEWPVNVDVALLERQPLAGGDPNLFLDDVDAGDELGDGMLDLDAGVDFEEEEVALVVEQELERAGVGVLHGAGGVDDRAAQLAAHACRSRATDGASSSSFWWRRWIEHSRSPRWTTVP